MVIFEDSFASIVCNNEHTDWVHLLFTSIPQNYVNLMALCVGGKLNISSAKFSFLIVRALQTICSSLQFMFKIICVTLTTVNHALPVTVLIRTLLEILAVDVSSFNLSFSCQICLGCVFS